MDDDLLEKAQETMNVKQIGGHQKRRKMTILLHSRGGAMPVLHLSTLLD
jgi:hypothetical protein